MLLISNQNKLSVIGCKWLKLFGMHKYINGNEFFFIMSFYQSFYFTFKHCPLRLSGIYSKNKTKQTSFTLLYFTKRIYVLCLDYACYSSNIYHSVNTLTSLIFIVFSLVVSDLLNVHFHIFHNGTHVSRVLVGDNINKFNFTFDISSVQVSRSVMSDCLRPHESQHARPPCPSPITRVHSDSRPSSQ